MFQNSGESGTIFVGNADIVGVRDLGGDVRGDTEAIAVEVKKPTATFGKILACKLIEVGFEYVCEMEDKKLFRKRK